MNDDLKERLRDESISFTERAKMFETSAEERGFCIEKLHKILMSSIANRNEVGHFSTYNSEEIQFLEEMGFIEEVTIN